MGSFTSDLRYAVRVALKNPRLSIVAIAALALGVGANAAIFSVVNAVLLRPLPYPDADRLVNGCRGFQNGDTCNASIPKYMMWRRARSFDAVAAYDFSGPGLNLAGADRPEQARGIHATSGYFRVFGATPLIGRTFSDDEDRPGGPRVVVLSHAIWANRFASDPKIAGRSLTINGEPYTVIGVLNRSFRSDPPSDLFIPLQPDPHSQNQGHYLVVGARLKPGVSLETARAEMKLLGDEFRRENPKWMSDTEYATVKPMQDLIVEDVRPALLVLVGAVGLVLLIACANVANLLLARAAGRQKEIALRAAVGASRGGIVRQLLTESILLAAVGGAVGVVAGVWGARALVALSPGDLPRAQELASAPLAGALLDWRVLAFTLVVSLATGLLFGLAPALHLARTDLGTTLKEGGGRGSTGSHAAKLRGALVVVELALALVLLVGATLLIRTFVSLKQVQPGFDARNILVMQTSLVGNRYSTTRRMDALQREISRRLDALPGVVASAITISVPTETSTDLPFFINGRPLVGDAMYHGDEQWRCVSWEYFKALAVPMLHGRVFDEHDTIESARVAVVNQAFAKKYWPGSDAVGQQITIGKGLGPDFDEPSRTIVGIVADVREQGLDRDAPPVMYVPTSQNTDALTRLGTSIIPMRWVVRATSDPAPLAAAIQKEFLAVDSQLPVARVRTMEQVLRESVARQSFNMLLLSIFAAIALGLAGIGIYGLMSYSVEQSAHDIGVRLALGASRADVLGLVVANGARLTGIGLAVGLAAAYVAVRLLARFLFGVPARDPVTFASVAALLGVIALLATYLPARRATAIDPIVALRE